MSSGRARPELSVVIPFLNEEENLPLLKDRLATLDGLPKNLEVLFVSDGSQDGSVALVERWAREDERIKLIVLTRNFGHQPAICAGLDYAAGERVAIMDADLQDPPEALLEMYKLSREGDWDIVYNVRSERTGPWLKRAAYGIFYRIYSRLAESPIDVDSGDFSVLSERAAGMLRSLPERIRFVRGLRSWLGLKSKAHVSPRPPRAAGRPQYSLPKLMALALNGLISFSARPLRLAMFGGLCLCAFSVCLSFGYIVAWWLYGLHEKVPGFTTIVSLLLFLSGAQFILLGVIGEYIGQIFFEVKRRPLYLVDRAVNLDSPAKPSRESA